jgi:catechol 2,3-dioxygenase-like lactoylglutathione lyase family enzyme
MTNEKMPHVIGVRHVGLSAQNPAVLADFYHDVLALEIVSTDTVALGPTAFLSSHPEKGSVDLVFFANPGLQHTAFEVSLLADLRAFHQRIINRCADQDGPQSRSVALVVLRRSRGAHDRDLLADGHRLYSASRRANRPDAIRGRTPRVHAIGGSSERLMPCHFRPGPSHRPKTYT